MEIITSRTNQTIKNLKKFREKSFRDQQQQLLVEGEHLVRECEQAGLLEHLYVVDETRYASFSCAKTKIHPGVAETLSLTSSGSDVFGLVRFPDHQIADYQRLLLCDGIQDPGNLGTIIRTAYSFGFDGVVLSENCVDRFNDKVVRSSQGAVFFCPLIRCDLKTFIKKLQTDGGLVYGTDVQRGKTPAECSKEKCAIVMGSEGQGVSAEVLSLCDDYLRIDTSRFESLNVAVAAGILCYEFRK